MKIIDKILKSACFEKQPPVLIDIGASEEINAKWKSIARYSYCIAFDADDREFKVTEQTNSRFKKLITINRIVTAEAADKPLFYLTDSPYCSSLLEPDIEKLKPWLFSPLFRVKQRIPIQAITIQQSLLDTGISYVDWFKTDTQGTDLRLFTHLPPSLRETVLAAEFEPGIMDAYKTEDKLYMVMQEMQNHNFWLSSMIVKGTQRIAVNYAEQFGKFTSERVIKTSPGWAEITYLKQPPLSNERQLLLLFVFACIEKQFGFALEITDFALQHYNTKLFGECREAVIKKIKSEKLKLPLIIFKRKFNKLFKNLND
jgi:hypothetical protein